MRVVCYNANPYSFFGSSTMFLYELYKATLALFCGLSVYSGVRAIAKGDVETSASWFGLAAFSLALEVSVT